MKMFNSNPACSMKKNPPDCNDITYKPKNQDIFCKKIYVGQNLNYSFPFIQYGFIAFK